MRRHPHPLPPALAALLAAACGLSGGGGGPSSSGSPNLGVGLPPELMLCRTRTDSPQSDSEISLRTAQNLGTARVPDKTGRELHAHLHPDGVRVVFARERSGSSPPSRELFVSSIDNTVAEQRLTLNNAIDNHPCWTPDGSGILFSTDRTGERRLWRCNADGGNPAEFLPAAAGSSDGEPEWHAATNRIAFSRRAPDGVVRIALVNGDGTGLVNLSTGAPSAGADSAAGDREPCFTPDGSTVTFVRRSEAGLGVLMQVDVATHTETLLFDPMGDVCLPRWSPHGDRLFLGISQPLAGRPGLRLSSLRADGSSPLLLLPDVRYQFDGLDVLPALAPSPLAGDPVALDTQQADMLVEAGIRVLGGQSMLDDADGADLVLVTENFDNHEVAGIDLTYTLPEAIPDDPVAVHVEAVIRSTRVGGNTIFRLALGNPVANRQDTVVEIAPASTAAQTLAFDTGSLAHISRERRLTVGVIGRIDRGDHAEFHIDRVRVVVTPRAPQPSFDSMRRSGTSQSSATSR